MRVSEFQIEFPSCAAHPSPGNTFTTAGPVVVVGANGAGKSRLAEWLEQQNPVKTHRVAAQRLLQFPDDFAVTGIDSATKALLFGHKDSAVDSKFFVRWDPARHDKILNDYENLVTLLFSEGAQASEEYFQRMKLSGSYEPPPVRKLDIIQRIWAEILPNRELVIGGNKVEARQRERGAAYNASEMSDGERVIFYLIGQCLCAPTGATIILDEPELHLHRAIQARLWDAVELERRDCLFVYLTHDLDFAASRAGGSRIWLREFSGGNGWEWDFVPDETALPEALLLEVLGSRKPVLFVEGQAGGTDERLYRLLFPAKHVVPMGGCTAVIHATATCSDLRSGGRLHIEATGLIDLDGRSEAEVEGLAKIGVKVLSASEIENLLISESIVRLVSQHLEREPEEDVESVKRVVFEKLSEDIERLATELAGRDLDRVLREWPWKHRNPGALKQSLADHLARIDVVESVARWDRTIRKIVDEGDYTEALRVYPNKGLPSAAGRILGLRDYSDFVLRYLASPRGGGLLSSLLDTVTEVGGATRP